MSLKRRFFSAPTLTQALLAAARHHSADPDAVDYKVIEKKQGFIKAPRGVVIEVDPDTPLRADAAAEPSEQAPAKTEESPAPAALEPVEAVPAGKSTEVPFEPAGGEEPAAHPALAAVTQEPEGPAPEAEPEVEAAAEPDVSALATATEVAEAEPRSEPAADVLAAEEGKATPADGPAAETTEADPTATEAVAVEAVSGRDADPEAATPAGGSSAPEISDQELREAVAEAIDELAFLASLRVQVARVESGDDGLEIELEGPDSSRLAARGGRALLAMQHLLPRLLFGRLGKPMRCHIDCDDFHAARGERLERLAQKAADRVRTGGRSWLLEPMAPDERRLIHMALAEVSDIETESVGQGFLKRVRVAQAEPDQPA